MWDKTRLTNIVIFRVGAVTFQFLIISTTMAKNMIEDQPARHLNPFVALISREGEVAAVTLTGISFVLTIVTTLSEQKQSTLFLQFSPWP